MQQSINLIKERSQMPEYLEPVQLQLKLVAIIALALSVVAGGITLLILGGLNAQSLVLSGAKQKHTRELDDLKPIESMFLVIQSRMDVVRKAMAGTMPVTLVFDTVTSVSDVPQLRSLNMNENGKVIFDSSIGSVEEAVAIVAVMKRLTAEDVIREPYLMSLAMNEEGMTVSLSYMQSFDETYE